MIFYCKNKLLLKKYLLAIALLAILSVYFDYLVVHTPMVIYPFAKLISVPSELYIMKNPAFLVISGGIIELQPPIQKILIAWLRSIW